MLFSKCLHLYLQIQLYKCAKCDYWSHNKYYLKQHVDLVHNAERVYKCPFCDYAGKRSHSLKEHLVVHSNYRPYVCSQCNASFRKKGHLTNHIKMHSQFQDDNLVCPVCLKNNFDNLLDMHLHLRKVHPNEVYACDICQYATFLNKGNITMHMLTHGNPKVYSCYTCNFTALHNKIMEEHMAECHKDKISGGKAVQVNEPYVGVTKPAEQFPKIWLKCSECGFSTDERDQLQDHMIKVHLSALKERSEPQMIKESRNESLEQAAAERQTVKLKAEKIEGDVKTREQAQTGDTKESSEYKNTYRCHQCEFQCDQAKLLITHMLKHKPNYGQNVILVKSDSCGKSTVIPSENKASHSKYTPTSIPERQHNINESSHPVTNQTYIYDESNKWYQCTLCGYSTDHQRTIKAHIWKHSGHKDLDYPMFQNGPLSVYDDTPMSIQLEEKTVKEMVPSKSTTAGKENQALNPSSIENLKESAEQVSSKKTQNALNLNERPSDDVTTVEVPENLVPNNKTFVSYVPEVLQQINATEGEYLVVQTRDGKALTQVRVQISKVEEPSKIAVEIKRPMMRLEPRDTQNDHLKEYLESKAIKIEPKTPMDADSVKPVSVKTENVTKQEQEFIYADIETAHGGEEIVLDSEVQHKTARNSVAHHIESAKRKFEEVVEDISAKKFCHDRNVDLQGEECQLYGADDIDVVGEAKSDQEVSPRPIQAPDMAAEIYIESSMEPLRRMSSNEDSSTDDDDDDDSHMSGSDAEVINLLSLLKKGSLEPAGQDTQDDTSPRDDCDSNEDSTSGSQRQGISSSLLAVIEQLRERTTSTSESNVQSNEETQSKALRRSTRKKLKTEKILQNLSNIEALSGDMFRCKVCKYLNPNIDTMRSHTQQHDQTEDVKKLYNCSLCEYQGSTSEELQEHMLQHCKLRTYPCKMCDATFSYKSQLRAHMTSHPMACKKCEFVTSSPGDFRKHIKQHDENRQLYVCQKCGICLQQKEDAEKHPFLCPNNNDKQGKKASKRQYKCEFCPAVANTQAVFKAHMKTHDSSQNLQCELCGFLAFSVRSLKSHMKRHINDQRFVQQPLEQYKCNLCGYVCHHLPSLKSHMWRHAADKNYNYEQINAIINRALENHTPECLSEGEDHQHEQPSEPLQFDENTVGPPNYLIMFRCCQCGFESVRKSSLNAHMQTHKDIIQKTFEVNQERLAQNKPVILVRPEDQFEEASRDSALQEKNLPGTLMELQVRESA